MKARVKYHTKGCFGTNYYKVQVPFLGIFWRTYASWLSFSEADAIRRAIESEILYA